jgi:hypothetical protein
LRLIRACRLDLFSNAIDVTAMTGPQLVGLVREHIEYFQLMLGDESTPAQIVSLIRRDVSGVVAYGRPSPAARRRRTSNRVPADA